jgi:hypothetical protein
MPLVKRPESWFVRLCVKFERFVTSGPLEPHLGPPPAREDETKQRGARDKSRATAAKPVAEAQIAPTSPASPRKGRRSKEG